MVMMPSGGEVDDLQQSGRRAKQHAQQRCRAHQASASPRGIRGTVEIPAPGDLAVAVWRLHRCHYMQMHLQLQYMTKRIRMFM